MSLDQDAEQAYIYNLLGTRVICLKIGFLLCNGIPGNLAGGMEYCRNSFFYLFN